MSSSLRDSQILELLQTEAEQAVCSADNDERCQVPRLRQCALTTVVCRHIVQAGLLYPGFGLDIRDMHLYVELLSKLMAAMIGLSRHAYDIGLAHQWCSSAWVEQAFSADMQKDHCQRQPRC